MTRSVSIAAAAAAILLLSSAAFAATSKTVPVKAKAAKVTKAAATKAAPAAAVATAADTVALSPGQLDAAGRVYTGEAACEFDQKVQLMPVEGKAGHFRLAHRNASYTLVPEETTTGAVRLEDRRAGIVWLQIPAKSMLMNSRLGQRMVDNCLHPEQRSAQAPADGGIGISTAQRD